MEIDEVLEARIVSGPSAGCSEAKNLVLDFLALGRGLNDQITGAERLDRDIGLQPGDGGIPDFRADLAARHLTVKIAADQARGGRQRFLRHIVENNLIAGKGEDVGNPVAHLACADHPNALDVHGPPP